MKTLCAEKHVLDILNDLIETCKEGAKGFQAASEGVRSKDLKTLFEAISLYRAQIIPELQEEIERLGGDPEGAESFLAALHRGWINIRSAISTKNDSAIISECRRGEDSAVRVYQEALREDLPPRTRQILENEYGQVKKTHNCIRTLEKEGGS